MSGIPEKKITIAEKSFITSVLGNISEQEWNEIVTRVKNSIKHRLYYVDSGAHCESELGLPAIDYYTNEAVARILEFKWRWNPKERTLTDQLIRIANSLISNQVDSYNRRSDDRSTVEYHESFGYDHFDEVYDDYIDKFRECVDKIVSKDEHLSIYWDAVKEHMKSNDIAQLMEMDIKKVYKQNDKLIYHAKKNCINERA